MWNRFAVHGRPLIQTQGACATLGCGIEPLRGSPRIRFGLHGWAQFNMLRRLAPIAVLRGYGSAFAGQPLPVAGLAAVEEVNQLPQSAEIMPREDEDRPGKAGEARIVKFFFQRAGNGEAALGEKIGEMVVERAEDFIARTLLQPEHRPVVYKAHAVVHAIEGEDFFHRFFHLVRQPVQRNVLGQSMPRPKRSLRMKF